jgi:hypothetical protein
MRYIHLNPVRANIVKYPEDYLWSSHRAYMGQIAYTWLHQDLVLKSFGESKAESLEKFLQYLHIDNAYEKQEFSDIRKSLHNGFYGDEAFIESFTNELNEEEAFETVLKGSYNFSRRNN